MDAVMDVKDRLLDYSFPLMLMGISVFYLLLTLLTRPFLLFRPRAFQHEWFRRFFGYIGPASAANPAHQSALQPLLAPLSGTLVDVGPGMGDQLPLLAPIASQLTHVYALEPTLSLHPALLRRARDCGLGDKYTVLGAGAAPAEMIPALHAAGVAPRSVDAVVSIKSLCSCPPPEVRAILQAFQGLLRQGGSYVFLEHVGNRADALSGAYQWLLNRIWPALTGGCRLDGRMDLHLRAMDGWARTEVRPLAEQRDFASVPFVSGRAVKA